MLTTQLRRWTVEDYHRMIAAGILTSRDRVELLQGQVVQIVPQNPPDAGTTQKADSSLKALLAGRASVRVQLPITLADSEPEPDIAIVRIDPGFYDDRHPGVANILLVIEIADSTVDFDRNQKALIYAQAGIADYWVLDVVGRQVYVLREPMLEGY